MAKSTGILTPLKYNPNLLLFYNSSSNGLVCSLCNIDDIDNIEIIENHYSWLENNGGYNYETHNTIIILTNLEAAESDYGLQMFNLLREIYSEHIITIDMNDISMFNKKSQDELMAYWLKSNGDVTIFDLLLLDYDDCHHTFHQDLYKLWEKYFNYKKKKYPPHKSLNIDSWLNWNMLVKPEWLGEIKFFDKKTVAQLNNTKSIIWLNH